MLLSIDSDGPVPACQQIGDSIVPVYQQIRNRIVEAIAAGELPAGSGLPSTRQLAVDLGINFHTVNKAYDLLRREGLLRIGRKAGAVVQRDTAGGPPGPAGSKTGRAGCGRCWPRPPPRACRPTASSGTAGLPWPGSHSQAGRGRQRGGNPVMTLAALTGYLAVPLFGALMAQGRRSPGRPVQSSGVEAAGVEVPCDESVAFGSPVMACPWHGLPGRRW